MRPGTALQGMRFAFFFLALVHTVVSAQTFSFGVKGGVPLTEARPGYDSYSFLSYVNTGRWTVGPTLELQLPSGLLLEVDALFRGYRTGIALPFLLGEDLPAAFFSIKEKAKAWDFPLLLKYRFPGQSRRPFVSAGPSLTHESFDTTSTSSCTGTSNCYPPGFGPYVLHQMESSRTRWGAVAGAGVEFQLRHLKIAPEVRVTRLTHPNSTQVSALVGFSF